LSRLIEGTQETEHHRAFSENFKDFIRGTIDGNQNIRTRKHRSSIGGHFRTGFYIISICSRRGEAGAALNEHRRFKAQQLLHRVRHQRHARFTRLFLFEHSYLHIIPTRFICVNLLPQ
jgi:hypothetical protein